MYILHLQLTKTVIKVSEARFTAASPENCTTEWSQEGKSCCSEHVQPLCYLCVCPGTSQTLPITWGLCRAGTYYWHLKCFLYSLNSGEDRPTTDTLVAGQAAGHQRSSSIQAWPARAQTDFLRTSPRNLGSGRHRRNVQTQLSHLLWCLRTWPLLPRNEPQSLKGSPQRGTQLHLSPHIGLLFFFCRVLVFSSSW